jgi:hypothetical protein
MGRSNISEKAKQNIVMSQGNRCAMFVSDSSCEEKLYKADTNTSFREIAHIVDASPDNKIRMQNDKNLEILKNYVKDKNPNCLLDDKSLIESSYNGIAVCANCHKTIDSPNYTVETLLEIKDKIISHANKMEDIDKVDKSLQNLLGDIYLWFQHNEIPTKEEINSRITSDEKIKLNYFDKDLENIVKEYIQLSNKIENIINNKNQDINTSFSETIAHKVINHYNELKSTYKLPLNTEKSKNIFNDFIGYFSKFDASKNDDENLLHACRALIVYYFHHCDIFEKK